MRVNTVCHSVVIRWTKKKKYPSVIEQWLLTESWLACRTLRTSNILMNANKSKPISVTVYWLYSLSRILGCVFRCLEYMVYIPLRQRYNVNFNRSRKPFFFFLKGVSGVGIVGPLWLFSHRLRESVYVDRLQSVCPRASSEISFFSYLNLQNNATCSQHFSVWKAP